MSSSIRIWRRLAAVASGSLAAISCLGQVQITLAPSSVIGGSSSWDGALYDSGFYPSYYVVDTQTGSINDVNSPSANYWLGSNSTANEYFVIDLGAAYQISEIDLFNTNNSQIFDRGTTTFQIAASNAVSFVNSSVDYNLVGGTTILSGSLSQTGNPITVATFTSSNGLSTGTAYQYIRFTATGYQGNGAGLSEIRVFGTAAIPEPSSYVALLGLGALGFVVWRRQS